MLQDVASLFRDELARSQEADATNQHPLDFFPGEYQLDLAPDSLVSVVRGAEQVSVAPAPVGGAWQGHYGVPLQAGDHVLTPLLDIVPETVLAISLVGMSDSVGVVNVDWAHAGGTCWETLATICLAPPLTHQRLDISLAGLAGRERCFRVVGGDTSQGSLNLILLRIAPGHRAGRVNALASYDLRLRNEVGLFSGNAYSHQMYATGTSAVDGAGKVEVSRFRTVESTSRWVGELHLRVKRRIEAMKPNPAESAFSYSSRALGSILPMAAPDFFARAREKAKSRTKLRPLRILSILAGAARVEEQLLGHCSGNVEITLLDASSDLIQRAADRLALAGPNVKVECLVGDINIGLPGEGRFDVIMCVSALHHVANLERVLSQVSERLNDDGEFWSIGEQIGRNGNRLWPEAYQLASELFAALPERLRRNSHTGQTDSALSDRDFSIGCFEGIRSEELEPLLEAYFIPELVYKRNAFLWRFVEHTYGDNFHLDEAEDLAWLRRVISAEIVHWATGGRSTEMHGVFRKKTVIGN